MRRGRADRSSRSRSPRVALLRLRRRSRADPPAGTPPSYATPTRAAQPAAIVAGPDGNLWFVETAHRRHFHIGTITPAGRSPSSRYEPRRRPARSRPASPGTSLRSLDVGQRRARRPRRSRVAPDADTTTADHAPDPVALAGIAADAAGDVWVALPARRRHRRGQARPTRRRTTESRCSSARRDFDRGRPRRHDDVGHRADDDQIASISAGDAVTAAPAPDRRLRARSARSSSAPTATSRPASRGRPRTSCGSRRPATIDARSRCRRSSTANAGVLAVGPDKLLWMAGAACV